MYLNFEHKFIKFSFTGNLDNQTFYDNAFNDSTFIKSESLLQKNTAFDLIEVSSKSKLSDVQNLFDDPICKSCYNCMERAIKSHSMINTQIQGSHQNPLDLKDGKIRDKRKATAVNTQSNLDKKSKKLKYKKNKSVSIIKYNNNDKVYALKVKETNTQSDVQNANNSITTCQVYSIQKHFPCESPDADLILTASKRKINKNNKKEQNKRQKNVSNTKTTVIAPTFRKRQIDSSQLPEQIMPSIEEMY